MPGTFILYEITGDVTWSQKDVDFDMISVFSTAGARNVTLPDAYETANALVINSDPAFGSDALTLKLPDTSTFAVLTAGDAVQIYCTVDVLGVPQWARGPLSVIDGSLLRDAYSASNVTTDRTYDANATTTDELADVLGTLINDLIARGFLQ